MQIQESKKYFRRPARPSKVYISDAENEYLNNFCSKCRNEKIEYGKTVILWKAGKMVHLYFEDSVPVELYATANEPAERTAVDVEEPLA